MSHKTPTDPDSQDSVLAGFIGPGELCRQLGKTPRTVARWHARGLGPPRVRVARMILYRVDDVRAWLEAHRERRELTRARQSAGGGR